MSRMSSAVPNALRVSSDQHRNLDNRQRHQPNDKNRVNAQSKPNTKAGLKILTDQGTDQAFADCFDTEENSLPRIKNGHMNQLERVMGIEPTLEAWEAAVLPLNYTRPDANAGVL